MTNQIWLHLHVPKQIIGVGKLKTCCVLKSGMMIVFVVEAVAAVIAALFAETSASKEEVGEEEMRRI